MINDMPSTISSDNVGLFADDSALWHIGLNIEDLIISSQNSLDCIQSWCNQWGFKISVTKSIVVLFTRKRKLPPIQLHINGVILPVRNEVRYLGVYFDRRLNYKRHIEYVVQKCSKRINLLRLLIGTSWGANKSPLLSLYRSLVRPIIEYGMEAYFSASINAIRKIEIIQSQCLRIAAGGMMSTPKIALQVCCNEMPLIIRRLQLCLLYKAKLLTFVDHPCHEVIEHSWHEIFPNSPAFRTFGMIARTFDIDKLDISIIKAEEIPPWYLDEINIDDALSNILFPWYTPDQTKAISLDYINESYHSHVHIYTDGSKIDEKCGAAVYVPYNNSRMGFRLDKDCSSFDCEVFAIYSALTWSKNNYKRNILVISDCMSAIHAINNNSDQISNISSNIQTCLFELQEQGCKTTLLWAPGHVGIPGNEVADKIAKVSAAKVDVDKRLSQSQNKVKSQIRQFCANKWDQHFIQSDQAFHYKTIFPSIEDRSRIPLGHHEYWTKFYFDFRRDIAV
ncbi:uncharacterized protein LOC144431279 [Styela clava]